MVKMFRTGSGRAHWGTFAERVSSYHGVCGSLAADLAFSAAAFVAFAVCAGTETAITTLWPWKVREYAQRESEKAIFWMNLIWIDGNLTCCFCFFAFVCIWCSKNIGVPSTPGWATGQGNAWKWRTFCWQGVQRSFQTSHVPRKETYGKMIGRKVVKRLQLTNAYMLCLLL